MKTRLEASRGAREGLERSIFDLFADLLRLPNTPDDGAGLRRNAHFLEQTFAARGFRTRLLEATGAPPALLATRRRKGARRTLGLYAHYDGQPVAAERWSDPPFSPTLRDGCIASGGHRIDLGVSQRRLDPELRVHARSAADDKGAIAALLGALDVLAVLGEEPACHLQVLLEGEEEIGSPHLPELLDDCGNAFAPDLLFVLDGCLHASGRPQIVCGVRGYLGLEITVYGAVRPLHSGTFGNWAPNPALDLCHLLATMKDRSGRVAVEGLAEWESAKGGDLARRQEALSWREAALRQELLLHESTVREKGLSFGPLGSSLNLRGLAAGGVGSATRNEIPDRAAASLDVRLAEGDKVATVEGDITRHLVAQGYHVVDREPEPSTRLRHPKVVRLEVSAGYPAVRTPPDHPAVAALSRILEAVAGQAPSVIPTVGGSLPLHTLREATRAPLLLLPIAQADNGQHGPDENLRLGNLFFGVDLLATLLGEELATGVS